MNAVDVMKFNIPFFSAREATSTVQPSSCQLILFFSKSHIPTQNDGYLMQPQTFAKQGIWVTLGSLDLCHR